MKAVILAAGKGNRLVKYTQHLPKGMLSFRGKPLLGWQVEQLRKAGIQHISIVTGYMSEKIQIPGVSLYHNENYSQSNMIESLMCLGEDLGKEDLVIAYSDILYSAELLDLLLSLNDDIIVAADADWREYWVKRYGTTEMDLESLSVNEKHEIIELGRNLNSSENLHYRYIGLNRFSRDAQIATKELYRKKKLTMQSWEPSGKSFFYGYFTDLIAELISQGIKATIAPSNHGWLEFDTARDYEMVCELDQNNQLNELICL
jgi:L-glutamine-phosphate cytidylyltransferase